MKKRTTYRLAKGTKPDFLKEETVSRAVPATPAPMIRTQIYLSHAEHDFLQAEAVRRREAMAAVIRSFIDEKMSIPDKVWEDNPMLAAAGPDPDWKGHEDGAINHDHYVYGAPKKWVSQNGKWVEAPPLPDDYYDNPKSRAAYDTKLEKMT